MTKAITHGSGTYKIETCQLSDVHDLMAIEQQCHSFPWSQNNFVTCFSSGYIIRKLLHKRAVIGFYILHTLPRIQEGTLMDICVLPSYQGQGIGSILMKDMRERLLSQRIFTVFLEVRATNASAIALYEKYGFISTGVRKDYYPAKSGREDAVLMMQELTE